MLSPEWRCSWSSADRRCSNYIWVINNFIAYKGATYIRGFTVIVWLRSLWIHLISLPISLGVAPSVLWQSYQLTHWGRLTHICVSKLTITGSDNGLSPHRRQAIIWTNVGILLIGPLGTYFSGILIEIHIFSFKKMYLKMSSGTWLSFCLGLNVK